jgi:hypothetical protein
LRGETDYFACETQGHRHDLRRTQPLIVMAGLVPAIHATPSHEKFRRRALRLGMDARRKAGHDVHRKFAAAAP